MKANMHISNFVKANRKRLKMTQQELAAKAGVGLRFVRELEGGKDTLQLAKVNQVLGLFGAWLLPGNDLDPYEILKEQFGKSIIVRLKNGSQLSGRFTDYTMRDNRVYSWLMHGTVPDKKETVRPLHILHQDIAEIKLMNQ